MPKWVTYVLIALAAYFLFFRRAFGGAGAFPMISPQNAPPAPKPGYVTEQQWLDVGTAFAGNLVGGIFNWGDGGTNPGGSPTVMEPTPADSGTYTF